MLLSMYIQRGSLTIVLSFDLPPLSCSTTHYVSVYVDSLTTVVVTLWVSMENLQITHYVSVCVHSLHYLGVYVRETEQERGRDSEDLSIFSVFWSPSSFLLSHPQCLCKFSHNLQVTFRMYILFRICGVATIRGLPKFLGLFLQRALQK